MPNLTPSSLHPTRPATNPAPTAALAYELCAEDVYTRTPDVFDAVAFEGTLHAERLLATVRPCAQDGVRFLAGLAGAL